jgi:hypothetical protein
MKEDNNLTVKDIIDGTYKPEEEEKVDEESEKSTYEKLRIAASADDCVVCICELKY